MSHPRQRVGAAACAAVLLILWAVAVAGPAFAARELPEVYRQEGFLMQVLLAAAAGNVTGAGRTELVLSGRNYETQENYVFLLRWNGGGFAVIWKSPNLYEPASHLAVAVGDFTGLGRDQIAVLTRTRWRIYAWQDGRMQLIHEEAGWGAPEEVGVVRHPDHPLDLIAISRQHSVINDVPQKGVELVGWRSGRFRLLWETPTIGRVRAITGGDLTGDGAWEVIVEAGVGNTPGTVEVWQWDEGGYVALNREELRPAAVFALATAPSGREHWLAVADDRGRAGLYRFRNGFELVAESDRTLGWAIASVAAGDFLGDGGLQLVVIGYPSRLHVLRLGESP